MDLELYRLLSEIRGSLYILPTMNVLDMFDLYDDRLGKMLDRLEAKIRSRQT